MNQAFICDAVRTPFGRFGGTLATLRADDLAALPLKALLERNPGLDPARIDDVIYGCANQAGEDNRNVARMGALLAGFPTSVTGTTVNRLCGSSVDAVIHGSRAIDAGDAVARHLEREAHRVAQRSIVLDDEDVEGFDHGVPFPAVAPAAASGTVRMNSAPCSGAS